MANIQKQDYSLRKCYIKTKKMKNISLPESFWKVIE